MRARVSRPAAAALVVALVVVARPTMDTPRPRARAGTIQCQPPIVPARRQAPPTTEASATWRQAPVASQKITLSPRLGCASRAARECLWPQIVLSDSLIATRQ